MANLRILIVGGVAGGASAAARMRRLDEGASITILERGPYVSFANCGLPYYVGNVIKDRAALELMTPELFKSRFNIDVRVNQEVIAIDRQNKSVKIRNLRNKLDYSEPYDKLILSTGAEPFIPPMNGLENIPYFKLRDIPDTEKISKFIEENHPKHAIVIGGGYIGLEVVENLHARGIKVSVIEMLNQVVPPFDFEMAQILHQELGIQGVKLYLNEKVREVGKDSNGIIRVKLESGTTLVADILFLSVGIRPESRLAKDAGLQLSPGNFIHVNSHMQTSDPDIYAVGDVVEVQNYILNDAWPLALAGPANREGRIAADNIAGIQSEFEGVIGTSVLRVFSLTAAMTGINEKMLKKKNIAYEKIYLHPNNHAGYYPDAVAMSIKLLFDPKTGKILGSQIIGGTGVDKRIDVIATAIKFHGSVYDLERLELAYAPPFGSAKDPVNMAGFIASNVLRGLVKIWHWHDLSLIKEKQGLLVDVRTRAEFNAGHFDGAINIPDIELRDNLKYFPKDKPIYLYCQVGFRGYLAYRTLVQSGFSNVYNLSGGYKQFSLATMTAKDFEPLIVQPDAQVEEQHIGRPREDVQGTSRIEKLDATGLMCPGPLNVLIKGLKRTPAEQYLEITATDPAFVGTLRTFAELNDSVQLIGLKKEGEKILATIHKIKEFKDDSPVSVSEEPSPSITPKALRPVGLPVVSEISVADLKKELKSSTPPSVIIDVREKDEWENGHLKQAILIPLGNLSRKLKELEKFKEKEVITVCHSGRRSYMAAQILEKAGFQYIRSLNGGMAAWISQKNEFVM